MQVRHSEQFGCFGAVDSATVVAINDFLWLDTDDVKPASDQADQGTPQANRQEFKDNFIGVSAQRSQATETADVRILKSGVADVECASATFEIGDLVGLAENGAGDALENQKVVGVAAAADAIGICVQREASAVTKVRIYFESSLLCSNAIDG